MLHRLILVLFTLLTVTSIQARGVYQHPDAFVNEMFNLKAPKPEFIWFTGDLAKNVKHILGHKPTTLRTRYWKKAKRSVWVLNEIGKEKDITAGFVINDNQVENVKVLIFRESRGWEVKRDAFTDQFKQVTLEKNTKLSKPIDGISGATLSVKALTKLTRLALYLHQHIQEQDAKK